MNNEDFLKIIRWIARIIGSVFVVFLFIFIMGEVIEISDQNSGISSGSLNFKTVATSVGLLIALSGLIIAFWWEGIGGLISFSGMFVFLLLVFLNPNFRGSYMIVVFLVPCLLYLFYWWLARRVLNKKRR
jgi:hypothetical protein